MQFSPKTKEGKQVKSSGMGYTAAPFAAPGEYSVELHVGEAHTKKKGAVFPDPRFQMNDEDRTAQIDGMVEAMVLSKKMALSVTAAKNLRRQIDNKLKDFKERKDIEENVRSALKSSLDG